MIKYFMVIRSQVWQKLIHWSQVKHADLPWRKDRTLYKTLISEIMLQQTTVQTVKKRFDKFIKTYPTISKLAKETEQGITISWKGLGYYRRAKNLLKIAKIIVKDFNNQIPLNKKTLLNIPGIGDYTAGAILAIGNNQKELAIDANIKRVLSRIYLLDPLASDLVLKKTLQQFFSENKILPPKFKSFRLFHEAIMDLGRSLCQARKINCEQCPLKSDCQAFIKNKTAKYLSVKTKISKYFNLKLLRVVVLKNETILGYQKPKDTWLAGQIEIPSFIIDCDNKKISQYPFLKSVTKLDFQIDKLIKFKSSITKYKITNYILKRSFEQFKKEFYFDEKKYFFFSKNEKQSNLSGSSTKALQYF